MAPKLGHMGSGGSGFAGGGVDPTPVNEQTTKWVNVTWMPHSTLSPTSHVCLMIRSAHVTFDPLYQYTNNENHFYNNTADHHPMEWKIRIGVYGIAGLLLVPIVTNTTAAPVHSRRKNSYSTMDEEDDYEEVEDVDEEDGNDNRTNPKKSHVKATILNATHDCWWDYFVQIPIRWRDLPRDAYLQFEVLAGSQDHIVYTTTFPFFSQYGKLVMGLQKLPLHHHHHHHNSSNALLLNPNRNHGLVPMMNDDDDDNNDEKQPDSDNVSMEEYDPVWTSCCILDQLNRMEQRSRRNPSSSSSAVYHHNPNDEFGQMPSVPWLDAMLKERAEKIIAEVAFESHQNNYYPYSSSDTSKAALVIELPDFDIPIIHEEIFYPLSQDGASGAVTPFDLSSYRKNMEKQKNQNKNNNNTIQFDPLELVTFLDYENERDNPVEDKYRTLAHDLLRGLVDPALKPNKEQRIRLAHIIDSPSYHPTREEKDLLWRFRFSLVDNRRALTKFLLAVDWTVDSEVVQAAELLEQWRKRSPIEVTDALKLLGKNVAFQTNLVRSYAIDTLAAAPDSELRLYLLQLVQALKYENIEMMNNNISSHETTTSAAAGGASPSSSAIGPQQVSQVSSLATFLINRAAANIQLANFLYWYLKVELADSTHGSKYREIFAALKARLSKTQFSKTELNDSTIGDDSGAPSFKSIVDSVSKLGSSLRITDDRPSGKPSVGIVKTRTFWDVLVEQDEFITGVLDIQQRCRESRGKKDAKEAELKSLLSKEGYDRQSHRSPVPLPSSPDIFVSGVNPETAKMFKSALYPALLDFHVEATIRSDNQDSGSTTTASSKHHHYHHDSKKSNQHHDEKITSYKVIVKTGDDLRQDQLVIMMIQLMDGLLKRAALDLCLTPYSILATSHNSGLVEFVDGAMPISLVLYNYNNSILQFFQAVAPQPGAKYDVRPDVMSTYVRSCAGYCVITYLLGVGDRHLDNILLRASGHFFHIDFGFIFGRDPKPLPPAFRLTREMVDGMGGVESSEYRQFCSLACQAYNSLRKSAGLVLNLLHLMSDAGIQDLSNNPTAEIAKVEERFKLHLTDEQADRFFIGLINDCLSAIAPRVMDVFHSFAVARR